MIPRGDSVGGAEAPQVRDSRNVFALLNKQLDIIYNSSKQAAKRTDVFIMQIWALRHNKICRGTRRKSERRREKERKRGGQADRTGQRIEEPMQILYVE